METGSTSCRYRCWSFVLVPCLLWSCLPPWQDLCLLSTFLLSHVLFYSLHHVRGMLILSTLVLLLWTKNLLARWYCSQVLTREFFMNLLYLLVTAAVSVGAVVVVWMPLYEAYACVVSRLDKGWAQLAMNWRNTVFLLLALALATSAFTHTDLVLSPTQVDNTGLVRVLKGLSRFSCRTARILLRQVRSVLRSIERTVGIFCAEFCKESRTLAAYCRAATRAEAAEHSQHYCPHVVQIDEFADQQEDDPVVADLHRSTSQQSAGKVASRRTRSDYSQGSRHSDLPSCSYISQRSTTRRLRSSDSKANVVDSASDLQHEEPAPPSSGSRTSSRSHGKVAKQARPTAIAGAAYRKTQRGQCANTPRAEPGDGDTAVADQKQSQMDCSSQIPQAGSSDRSLSSMSSVSDPSNTSIHSSLTEKLRSCVLPKSASVFSAAALSAEPSCRSITSSLPLSSMSSASDPSNTSIHSSLSEKLRSCVLPKSASVFSAAALSTEPSCRSITARLSKMLQCCKMPEQSADFAKAPSDQSLDTGLSAMLKTSVMPGSTSEVSTSASFPHVSVSRMKSSDELRSLPRTRRQARLGQQRQQEKESAAKQGSRQHDHNLRPKSPALRKP